MKWQIAILMAVAAVPASNAADKGGKADWKALEGTWDVVSMEVLGDKKAGGKGRPDKLVIRDGRMTFLADGNPLKTFNEIRIELDPTGKPKELDVVRSKKEILPCIYEVTGDELKLAMPLLPGKGGPKVPLSRPTSFDTKKKPIMVLTAKRGKSCVLQRAGQIKVPPVKSSPCLLVIRCHPNPWIACSSIKFVGMPW